MHEPAAPVRKGTIQILYSEKTRALSANLDFVFVCEHAEMLGHY